MCGTLEDAEKGFHFKVISFNIKLDFSPCFLGMHKLNWQNRAEHKLYLTHANVQECTQSIQRNTRINCMSKHLYLQNMQSNVKHPIQQYGDFYIIYLSLPLKTLIKALGIYLCVCCDLGRRYQSIEYNFLKLMIQPVAGLDKLEGK